MQSEGFKRYFCCKFDHDGLLRYLTTVIH